MTYRLSHLVGMLGKLSEMQSQTTDKILAAHLRDAHSAVQAALNRIDTTRKLFGVPSEDHL